jgi:hypothetical protein
MVGSPRATARLLRAGERLPSDVSDRQQGHLDRPPAGMHGPRRRRREAVQHQPAQNLDCEAVGQQDRLGASERRVGDQTECRFCSAPRPLFRGLIAIGRRSGSRAPAAPAHPRPERRHRHVVRPGRRTDDRLVAAKVGTRRPASELRSPACSPASSAGLVR